MDTAYFCPDCEQIQVPRPTVSYDKRCPICNTALQSVCIVSDTDIDTLQTRVAELEQDRKRLEYIKHELEHDNCTVWKSVNGWHYSSTGTPETCQTFDTFNEAVDTAMKASDDR